VQQLNKIGENYYMHILGRIKLPKSAEVSSLYVQYNEAVSINYNKESPEIFLSTGGLVSLNSYFNSFYEEFFAKYTNLHSIYYFLKLEGNFQVFVYREVYKGKNRELISLEKFENCQLTEPVKVVLPNLIHQKTAGRIYLEIVCCGERGLFQEGWLATEQNKNREVSLGIITCTFKKETYIRNTVNTLLQDKLLQNKNFKIFVIDNGRTLNAEEFKDLRVQLIPNKNLGGSGGFTRGLVEALESKIYSHILFMDDDIELDSECIYKLFSLYEYAKINFAVAGSMIDLYKKYVLYEAGGSYGKDPKTMGFEPFSLVPLKNALDLQEATSLNLLLLEEPIDYGGFWFFSFPKEIAEEIGLPMPFFIKTDDVEFGLRITERFGSKIVAFPGLAVWHEPFYAKSFSWYTYYHYRNDLITHNLHGSLRYLSTVGHITTALIFALLIFDYNSAEMLIKAFEDYVEGPDIIRNKEPEILHSNILKLSKSYKSQKIQQNYLPSKEFEQKSSAGIFKKIASLLTINGHLVPNSLTTDNDVFIWNGPAYPSQRAKAFMKKRVFIFNEESGSLFQNEIDKLTGIKLLNKWLKVAAKSSINWSSINTRWKNASTELRSTRFWQQYLEIKE
jgi:galactofuranosylgalactofuranosylrhamnosyl-N-acetylglucosaminyl-diphospho-decaprenol beta-1,5/1,6-galactofuranosyltransferase